MEISPYDPYSDPNRPVKPQFELYTIPSHSSWFRWDDIHETERTALREFFDGSSISRTPKIYKEYRDFIINKYREDPSRRLTFTQVRKSLVGDVSLLRKVYNFLDKWSLINFSASDENKKKEEENCLDDEKIKSKIRVEDGPPNGVRVVATPNSLKPISASSNGEERRVEVGGFRLPPLTSFSDVFGDLLKLKEVKCGNCGEKFDSSCYEYDKGDFVICVKCFESGIYGEEKSKDDFKLSNCIENSVTHGTAWTEAETLLLLESVMKHGDDWDLVAQNVKTKTKLDCISKLIEMPFGEALMGSIQKRSSSEVPTESANSVKVDVVASSEEKVATKMESEDNEPMKESKVNGDVVTEEPPAKRKRVASVLDADSSLIKQVSHIATMAGPRIASAAAEAAITALCDESSCPRDIFNYDEDHVVNGLLSPTLPTEPEAHQADASEVNKESGQTETRKKPPKRNEIPLTLRIRAATATALGAAAANAKVLADQENREIEHLVSTIIETQLKKLYRKIKHFDDLEVIMEKEYDSMLELKESIIDDRINVLQKAIDAGVTKWRGSTGGSL